MKRNLHLQAGCDEGPSEQRQLYTQIPKLAESELNQFYIILSKTEGKPVLLSHTPGFNDSYVTINHLPIVSKPITELYDPSVMSFSYLDLLQRCEESYNNYVITADQVELVKKNT